MGHAIEIFDYPETANVSRMQMDADQFCQDNCDPWEHGGSREGVTAGAVRLKRDAGIFPDFEAAADYLYSNERPDYETWAVRYRGEGAPTKRTRDAEARVERLRAEYEALLRSTLPAAPQEHPYRLRELRLEAVPRASGGARPLPRLPRVPALQERSRPHRRQGRCRQARRAGPAREPREGRRARAGALGDGRRGSLLISVPSGALAPDGPSPRSAALPLAGKARPSGFPRPRGLHRFAPKPAAWPRVLCIRPRKHPKDRAERSQGNV